MAEADGSIRIKAELDTSGMSKDLQQMYGKFQRQTEAMNRQEMALKRLKKQYDEYLSGAKNRPEFLKFYDDLSTVQKNIANTDFMKHLARDIDLASSKYQRLRGEVRNTEREISKIGGSKIGNFFGKIFGSIGNAFERMKNQSKGVGTAIGGITSRLPSMAKTMFIFNLINKGFSALRDSIGGLIQQDSVLSGSLNQIKASLWTAFAPIWSACLPAIRSLGQALSWVSQLISSVVSRLFGKTVSQSEQMAKQMYSASQGTQKLSKGMKDTAKNTKKAAGELASFDKIEVLNQKDDEIKVPKVDKSDIGGGGSAPLTFPVQVEFETKNADTIDKITRIFKQMGRIVSPIIKGIKSDINWLWNKLFGEDTTGKTWLDAIGDSFENIANFMNETPFVKDFFVSLAEGLVITAAAFGVFAAATSILGAINWVFLAIASGIGIVIFAIKNWGKICAWFEGVWNSFIEALSHNWNNFISAFSGIFTGYWEHLKKSFQGIWESIIQIFKGYISIFKGIWDVFTGVLTGNWEKAWNGIKGIVQDVWGVIKGILNGIMSMIANFINGITTGINSVTGVFSGLFGLLGMSAIPKIPRWNPPRLAQGTVLKGGDPFLAWVNDQPRGQTNVETPLSTMVQAFRVAMQDFQGNNQAKVVIEPNGSMGELIRLLNFEIKKEQNFQGSSFIVSGV